MSTSEPKWYVCMSLDFLATTPQLRAVEIRLEGKSKAHG